MRNPTVNKSHRMICMNVLETLYQMVIVSRISNEFAHVCMEEKNRLHNSCGYHYQQPSCSKSYGILLVTMSSKKVS